MQSRGPSRDTTISHRLHTLVRNAACSRKLCQGPFGRSSLEAANFSTLGSPRRSSAHSCDLRIGSVCGLSPLHPQCTLSVGHRSVTRYRDTDRDDGSSSSDIARASSKGCRPRVRSGRLRARWRRTRTGSAVPTQVTRPPMAKGTLHLAHQQVAWQTSLGLPIKSQGPTR